MYLCYTLVVIWNIFIHFITQFFLDLTIWALSFSTCVLWHVPTIVRVCVCVCFFFVCTLPYFLVLQGAPGSSYICSALTYNQPFLQGDLVLFYWELVLETKVFVLNMLATPGVWLLLGHFSWQIKEIYVCILIHVYTHIYTYFYM